jgi:hypothetical protein
VSRLCVGIGSPCLRHCVHGAPIIGGADDERGRPAGTAAALVPPAGGTEVLVSVRQYTHRDRGPFSEWQRCEVVAEPAVATAAANPEERR